jgi:hypothetical protein
MRRVKRRVPYEICKKRALSAMRRYPIPASMVAESIWPDAKRMNAQGAGAAASRILKRMVAEGLVRWTSDGKSWGYIRSSREEALCDR